MTVANHTREDEWRVELQSTLTELAAHLRRRPPVDRPITVQAGDNQVEVTPAERELLVRVGASGGAGVARHLRLVCDALVLRAKLLGSLAELGSTTEEGRAQASAQVRRDVDIGYQILHAMQGELAVLMSTGKVEHGRRIAEHRGLLGEALQAALRVLGDAGEAGAGQAGAATGRSGRAKETRQRGRAGQARQTSAWVPKVVAGLLLALLAVLLLQLWSGRARDLPKLNASDFPGVPGVERVVCRPPAVILLVTGDQWSKLSRDVRVMAVDNASLVVEHHGYRHLELRSGTGATLAEWRKGGNVVLGK